MNILITGIHGFVGSNLVASLKRQHTIYTKCKYISVQMHFSIMPMNRNVEANRVSDPDDTSGGLLHFFNRYYGLDIVSPQKNLLKVYIVATNESIHGLRAKRHTIESLLTFLYFFFLIPLPKIKII